MFNKPARPANCGECAFWRKLSETEGLCCRHAPRPSKHSDQPAHWPRTGSWQWCGEGVAAAFGSMGACCADCAFWRRPKGGLNPMDRGDTPMSWWERAGFCARHAPFPEPESWPHAFWPATEDVDFCAEGQPRSHAEITEAATLRGDGDP